MSNKEKKSIEELELTAEQQSAVESRGKNLLVSASAGSGKTTVMVRRILALLREGCSLKDMLIITFTTASAADMRQKISESLIECSQNPLEKQKEHFLAQLRELPSARIGTIDSWCQRLVKTYFYVCNVGADFDLLDEGESKAIINLVIDRLLEKKMKDEEFSEYYDSMIENRSDYVFREIVEKLYRFATTQAEPEKWLASCLSKYDEVDAKKELDAYYARKKAALKTTLDELRNEAAALKYDEMVKTLNDSESKLDGFSEKITPFRKADSRYPTLNEARKELNSKINAHFLEKKNDGERQDSTECLREAEIIRDFTAELYKEVRREKLARSKLDFNDVEHLAYEIMQDKVASEEIKSENKFVFVDEYQDVNPLQDALIKNATYGNTYVVGDVKQSIYAFRMSDPDVFVAKLNDYEEFGFDEPKKFRHNFRSRKEILDFCNAVFLRAMTPSFGKVDYVAEALVSGKGETGGRIKVKVFPRAEKTKKEITGVYSVEKEICSQEDESTLEADAVVNDIVNLIGKMHYVKGELKPIMPKDIAVLFRVSTSPSVKQIYDKLKAKRIDVFLKSKIDFSAVNEIKPLISFLRVISNGYDDIALSSYLLSPLVGLNEDELFKSGGREIDKAEKSTESKEKNASVAIKTFKERLVEYANSKGDEIAKKLKTAFADIEKYRNIAPTLSVSELIGELVSEKRYFNILLASENGCGSAELLSEYLDFLSNLKSAETVGEYLSFVDRGKQEAECRAPENALKIMSVHASKGLEFPFVFLISCEKQFDQRDLKSRFLLDRDFGLCIKRKKTLEEEKSSSCKDDENRLWKAQKIRKSRALNEEALRLLYVAMTRAQEGLYVYTADRDIVDPEDAKCFADWILPVADGFDFDGTVVVEPDKNDSSNQGGKPKGSDENDSSKNGEDSPNENDSSKNGKNSPNEKNPTKTEIVEAIKERLNYKYKHRSVALKGSVTGIAGEESRSASEHIADDDRVATYDQPTEEQKKTMKLGTAYHKIMELIDFSADFPSERKRLNDYFTVKIDDDTTVKIDDHSIECSHRLIGELVRLEGFTCYKEHSFVYNEDGGKLVQGIIDLMLVNEDKGEVVLLDYKLTGAERLLKDEYVRQINYYANAVEDVLGYKIDRLLLYSFTGKRAEKVERKRNF